VYYYHFDGLGSVAALSDVNSVIVERYRYDVFGEPNTTSSIGNPYLFTGRRYDTETGLYYYRARYYKTDIGRFLQADPIGYAGGLNLYAYCGNAPVNWIDPLGLHIMNILPMMRVPSIKWALGNQGEKGKELTREELEREMAPFIRRILRRSRWWGGLWPSNYYRNMDSGFNLYHKSTRYYYMGQGPYTGEEINYYLQGILHRHYMLALESSGILVRLNNWRYFHGATDGEYIWTIYGYYDYEYWVEKLKN